jgi:hypothetical protein
VVEVEFDDELELDDELEPDEDELELDDELLPELEEVVPLEDEPPPEDDEFPDPLDELIRLGATGPRFCPMSLPMRVSRARVTMLCSTRSRPSCTCFSCTSMAM